jgi:PadR family transcriptional regulator, regulatory protein PadR
MYKEGICFMKINKELLKGSTATLVLSLLNSRPMYGYEIIKVIETRSNGIFSFKEGTLYPILHSLEGHEMIEAYWSDSEEGRKRKYYKITDKGRLHMEEKKEEWSLFSSTINKVLGEV